MKRIFATILLLSVGLSMIGCSFTDLNRNKNVKFYYQSNSLSYQTSSSILTPEVRDRTLYADDVALLNYYFKGPESEDCINPFPTEVRTTKITTSQDSVNIYMNDRFSDIKGLNFTVACSCLSKTLMELYQRDKVKIFAARNFSDGSLYIEITQDRLLLWEAV